MTPALVRLDEAVRVAEAYEIMVERRRQRFLETRGNERIKWRAMWFEAVEQYEAALARVKALTEGRDDGPVSHVRHATHPATRTPAR